VALPLILAGPILRRVEPTTVAVWMAVSRPSMIEVDVYHGIVDAHAPVGSLAAVQAPVVAAGSGRTRRVGERLHAAVVVADAAVSAQALLAGQLYSYNVTITPEGGAAADLNSERLLINAADDEESKRVVEDARFHLALGYARGRLPGFATCPARTEDLVVMHGSCQKPHGNGAPMQAQFDATIEAVKDDPVARPHVLVLTGDQIYADDVATCLLPGLAALGDELLGIPQKIKGPGTADVHDAGVATFPPARRAKMMALAGLTPEPDEARNHLMSLGEYCAMYVLAFNSIVWPTLAKGYVPKASEPGSPRPEDDRILAALVQEDDDETVEAISHDAEDEDSSPAGAAVVLAPAAAGPLDPSLTDIRAGDATRDSADEMKRRNKLVVEVFHHFIQQKLAILGKTADAKIHQRADTARFRRALANVPTHMQFDDHDVTDDWFITGEWRSTVLGNVLGQAIVRNAVVAGTIFQAWGNDPAAWASGDRAELLDAIELLFPSGAATGPDDAASVRIDTVLGLKPGADPKFDFSVTVDGPTHRLVVLDTRTRREYETAQSPPGLLSQASLDQQLPAGPLPSGLEVLIVVSPAPVLGPALITDFAQPGLITEVDFSAGIRMKKKQRDEEVETGIPGGRLPGSDTWDLEQWHVNPPALERLLDRLSTYPRVVILAGDVHYGAAFALAYERREAARVSRIVHFTSSAMRNAWKRPFPDIMSHNVWARVLQHVGLPKRRLGWDAATPDILADAPVGERLSLRGRLHRSPVLLPDEGWAAPHTLVRAPDWVWELDMLLDERPAVARPEATRVPELSEPDVGPLPVDPPAPAPPAAPLALLHPPGGQLGYARLAQAHQESVGRSLARGLQFLNNVGKITFRRTAANELEVSQALISLLDKPEDDDKPAEYVVYTSSLAPLPPTIPTQIGAK
jgi:hypothetical protein